MSDEPDIKRVRQRWGEESVEFKVVQLDARNETYIFITDELNGNVSGSREIIEQCRESSISFRDFLKRCEDAGVKVTASEI